AIFPVPPHSPGTTTLQHISSFTLFFYTDPATTEIYTLSLHDALPISPERRPVGRAGFRTTKSKRLTATTDFITSFPTTLPWANRSEEHTSELQSRFDLVCRLLLEKKKKKKKKI